MNIRVVVASALALAVIAPASANALTITNGDAAAYSVKLVPKSGKTSTVALKASSSADVDCKHGCKLILDGKSMKVSAKTTKITIKDGKFVL